VKLPLAQAANGAGISKLWARRKIAEYEVDATLGRIDQAAADKAVLQVALDHQIVSSKTSLVAVDKSPKRPPGYQLTRADVPLNLPAGWVWESVFGDVTPENTPHLEQKASADFLQLAKAEAPKPAPDLAQVALPQTATDGQMLALFGLVLGFFGLMLMRKREVMA
jgi:Ca-activated chloride channel family protein